MHPVRPNGVIVSEVTDMPTRKKKMSTVDSWSDVPKFATEAEEVEWWSTHEPGEGLLTQMKGVPLSQEEQTVRNARTHPVAIRFDDSTLERVRTLAHRRHNTVTKLCSKNSLWSHSKKKKSASAWSDTTTLRCVLPGSPSVAATGELVIAVSRPRKTVTVGV
jgi:hypothetical protein